VQTITRWLVGKDLPPGVLLKTGVDGQRLNVDLYFTDEWEKKLLDKPSEILLADGVSDEILPLTWERLKPGHYHSSYSLKATRWYRGVVNFGEAIIPFGPVSTGVDPEWSFNHSRVRELKNVSKASGGRELVNLSNAWETEKVIKLQSFRSWLLIVLLIFFLFEALVSRIENEVR